MPGHDFSMLNSSAHLIDEQVLTGATASFDFQNIPPAYRHLQILYIARGDIAANNVNARMRFNNDSGTNYLTQWTYGQGTAAPGANTFQDTGSAHFYFGEISAASATANHASYGKMYIPFYADTTFFKSFMAEFLAHNGSTTFYSGNVAGIWKSTAVINRVTIFPATGNFITGSRIAIYGVM